MPSHLPSVTSTTQAGTLPSSGFHRLHRYYGPLGLPLGTIPFHLRLIGTAFAGRRPPSRVSPVPHHSFAACRLPYPGRVLRGSGPTHAVCCLRPDMTGSASSPFGSSVTGLQRFTRVRPAASLPSSKPYSSLRAFDAPLRRRNLSRRREPATRRTGMLTVAGLPPAGLMQHYDPVGRIVFRTHHARIVRVRRRGSRRGAARHSCVIGTEPGGAWIRGRRSRNTSGIISR